VLRFKLVGIYRFAPPIRLWSSSENKPPMDAKPTRSYVKYEGLAKEN
jgi:hypothetical protein